ncbi:amino acid carrier protein [Woeseiaceae bacterium]|nr:amino acid carrier protein [Woeseiaceae bacterium]
MENLSELLMAINAILWNGTWLYIIVGTGILFTVWSGVSQYRALTHGPAVVRGVYDNPDDPGAINHFQALSAALSGTVGLGNIGGVALAITLGGPGAIFWMWVVGFLGMAIKMTEVTMSMLYRNTNDPNNPNGGPMWVADKAFVQLNPKLKWLGKTIAIIFCICLLMSAATGGNMFQAWNIAEVTNEYFGIPGWVCGLVLASLVAAVIIGGIKRIGKVAGTLVPFMVGLYLLVGFYVLFLNIEKIPSLFAMIISNAFTPTEASGAFIGGTIASAFLFGMKRAVFSNEAGQGSSPIAHSAAKTDEPVREGLVAGLEPFIDTIVVCTFTALIILATGIWNRGPDAIFTIAPDVVQTESGWQYANSTAPVGEWQDGEIVTLIVKANKNPSTSQLYHRINGVITAQTSGFVINWDTFNSPVKPEIVANGVYKTYVGATLTAKALDLVLPGLGKWLITIASWLFGLSTLISWAYYGEQGIIYLAGNKGILPFKLVYCGLAFLATLGHIQTDADLDNMTGIGTGVMIWVNLPICWIFGYQAMRAYKKYIGRLKDGRMNPNHLATKH